MKDKTLTMRISIELLDKLKMAKVDFEKKCGLKLSMTQFLSKLLEDGIKRG